MPLIALTGATGGLGSQVLKYLLTLVPPSSIIVSLSPASKPAPDLASTGVTVRHGDYAKPETLTAAFKGADTLLLVSYPSIAHAERVANHVRAIDAAKAVGVRRIVYTSLAFGDGSTAAVMQAHLDTEAYLKQSGLVYTIVREGLYTESFPLYMGFFEKDKEGPIYVPGDGGVAWVAREDLGDGTARLLISNEYDNATVLLSGARVLTLTQLAALVSQLLGRPVPLRIVPVDEYVSQNRNASPADDVANPRGNEAFLRAWATTYPALEQGDLAIVDPLLQTLVGRPLVPVEKTIKKMLGLGGDGGVLEQYAK